METTRNSWRKISSKNCQKPSLGFNCSLFLLTFFILPLFLIGYCDAADLQAERTPLVAEKKLLKEPLKDKTEDISKPSPKVMLDVKPAKRSKKTTKKAMESTPRKETPKPKRALKSTPKKETPKRKRALKSTPKKETPKRKRALKSTPKKETPKRKRALKSTPKKATPKRKRALKSTPRKEATKPKRALKSTPKKATPKRKRALKSTPRKEATKPKKALKSTSKEDATNKKLLESTKLNYPQKKSQYFYIGLELAGGILANKNVVITPGLDRKKNSKTILAAGAVLGYSFDFGLRSEIAATYNTHKETLEHTTDTATGNVNTIRIMFNNYYDLNKQGDIMPYVGLGAGVSFVTSKLNLPRGLAYNTDNKDVVPTFMAGFGTNIKIDKNILFDIGYRYIRAQDVKFVSGDVRHDHVLVEHYITLGFKLVL